MASAATTLREGPALHLVLVATGPRMHLNRLHEFVVKLPIPLGALEGLRPDEGLLRLEQVFYLM